MTHWGYDEVMSMDLATLSFWIDNAIEIYRKNKNGV